MKSSVLCVSALLCLSFAGQLAAQAPADSYRKAGAAYYKAGQYRESVKAYQQVIRLSPNDSDAYQHLGDAFTRLNMNKEAAEAYEKQADLLVSGGAAPAPRATPAAAPPAQQPTPAAKPAAAAGIAGLTYKVGSRVEYVYDGKWFKAVIIAVRDDSANYYNGKMYAPYRVHAIGFKEQEDTWVCCADNADHRTQLRPAGSGPTEPVPGGEANDEVLKAMSGAKGAKPSQPAAKEYTCGIGNPITITGSGTYDGGTYTFNSATSILTFHGGIYDGQRASYEVSYGLAKLHILGQSGRPVIDCD